MTWEEHEKEYCLEIEPRIKLSKQLERFGNMWLRKIQRRFFSNTKKYKDNSYRILRERINKLWSDVEGLSLASDTIYFSPEDDDYKDYLLKVRNRKIKAIHKLKRILEKYET